MNAKTAYMPRVCPCGSEKSFSYCCEPYILQIEHAPHPEALMRSRYSAYVVKAYDYILSTYALSAQKNIALVDIVDASKNTKWLQLKVMSAFTQDAIGEVEFIAYYQLDKIFYAMHELSRFIKEDQQWYYVNGDMLGKSGLIKLGRNDNCLCGSGKKYKRCCAA